ncbi:AAA family ATPase [Candidatus Woesearchaeota archaeon]|nr:AAA family ATPase [Candidatus Woesearchaeota archaeon]
MKTVAIISSKGGVGKTMVSVSLIDYVAKRGKKVIAVDADVNAPNLAKWFDDIEEWDTEKEIKVFPLPNRYKKCKDLKLICDGKELRIEDEKRGKAYLARGFIPSFAKYNLDFVYGDILQGKTGSGKVVEQTLKLSENGDYDLRIIDTAPGTGYPVITAIKNSDYVIIVTEATELGLQDLIKLIEIAKVKPYGIFINKVGDNKRIVSKIQDVAGNDLLGSLDYDTRILSALEEHKPPLLIIQNKSFENFLETVLNKLGGET